jgi:hypothetical protein
MATLEEKKGNPDMKKHYIFEGMFWGWLIIMYALSIISK